MPDRRSARVGYQLLGDSPAMQQVRALIERLARSQAPVFITGDSGSGKELAARMIHARRAARRAAVHRGQLRRDPREPDGERVLRLPARARSPAPTTTATASSRRPTAARCSSTRSPTCRWRCRSSCCASIQEKRVRKVGATQEEPVDVRIISATHKKLEALVESGEFRQDLYYRLHVIELAMPSLREMREDIPLFASTHPRQVRARDAGEARCRRARRARGLPVPGQRARAREHPRAGPVARRGSAAASPSRTCT